MRIARLALALRSPFDLKCLLIDREGALADDVLWSLGAEAVPQARTATEREIARQLRDFSPSILHVYGSGPVPHRLVAAAGAPWVADRPLAASRPFFARSVAARAKALGESVPEPVAEEFFAPRRPGASGAGPRVGSVRQSSRTATLRDLVEARIRRFRDDVEWTLFDAQPPLDEMARLDLWVDLADDESELDGLVAEALTLGLPVVATRTAANRLRSGDGRAALLCPKGDPNEMAHAVVTMLFKPERRDPIVAAASSLREQFRPAARRAALLRAYAEVSR